MTARMCEDLSSNNGALTIFLIVDKPVLSTRIATLITSSGPPRKLFPYFVRASSASQPAAADVDPMRFGREVEGRSTSIAYYDRGTRTSATEPKTRGSAKKFMASANGGIQCIEK